MTLNVPEGAEVTLAGNSTKATGEVRTFRTSQLAAGQIWDDYEIEVKMGDKVYVGDIPPHKPHDH